MRDQTPASEPEPASPGFTSLLAVGTPPGPEHGPAAEAFIHDLNLDQIIEAVAGERDERDLIAELLYHRPSDIETVEYRHEVFLDLEDADLFQAAGRFSERMRQARLHLTQLTKMSSRHQREGWFLDAAAIYCDAVHALASDLAARPIASRGLLSFRDYLTAYVDSAGFAALTADTARCKADLSRVMYQVRESTSAGMRASPTTAPRSRRRSSGSSRARPRTIRSSTGHGPA
jgi:DNA mismatch repair protein MutS